MTVESTRDEEMRTTKGERCSGYLRDFCVSFENENPVQGDDRMKKELQRVRCSGYMQDFLDASDSLGHILSLKQVDASLAHNFFAICKVPQEAAACTITQVDEKRGLMQVLCNVGEVGHTALDIAGLVPMVGELADLANAGLYCLEKDYANAAISAAAAIPFYGNAATACKIGKIQANADEILEDIQDITQHQKQRMNDISVGGSNAAVAIPALATGIVIGAVGARKYWYRGLRAVVKMRKWLRGRPSLRKQ